MDQAHLDAVAIMRDIDLNYRHQPLQVVLSAQVISATECVIVLDRHNFTETSTMWIIKSREMRMIHYTRTNGKWVCDKTIISPDLDFVPYVYRNRGASVQVKTWVDKRRWEALCYRPGNARNPMDGPHAQD